MTNEPASGILRILLELENVLPPRMQDAEARLMWVSTFAVSALASNFERMGKPFNPLLGETYELKRPDFRIVCEQVSQHRARPKVLRFAYSTIEYKVSL